MRWTATLCVALTAPGCAARVEPAPPPLEIPHVSSAATAAPAPPAAAPTGELLVVSEPRAQGFAGGSPAWDVAVSPPDRPADNTRMLAVGRLDEAKGEAVITHLFPGSPEIVAWPGHPEAIVLSGREGLRVLDRARGREWSVADAGRWALSPDGAFALVTDHDEPHLALYETETWTKRFSLPVAATGYGSFAGSRYVEAGDEGALVVDLAAGRVLFQKAGAYAALSASRKTLAWLTLEGGEWIVSVVALDALERPRRASVGKGLFIGLPEIDIEGERTVFVRERQAVAHGDYHRVDRARVDVATGRAQPARGPRGSEDDPPYLYSLRRADHRTLVRSIGHLVAKPRQIIPAGGHTSPYGRARKGGLVVAAAGTPDGPCESSVSYCFMPDAEIVFADTRSKKLVARLPLPADGPVAVVTVDLLTDERSALVCARKGDDDIGFLVDAAERRVVPLGAFAPFEWKRDEQGTKLLDERRVIDVARRGATAWPRIYPLRAGRVCRTGVAVAPEEACAPGAVR